MDAIIEKMKKLGWSGEDFKKYFIGLQKQANEILKNTADKNINTEFAKNKRFLRDYMDATTREIIEQRELLEKNKQLKEMIAALEKQVEYWKEMQQAAAKVVNEECEHVFDLYKEEIEQQKKEIEQQKQEIKKLNSEIRMQAKYKVGQLVLGLTKTKKKNLVTIGEIKTIMIEMDSIYYVLNYKQRIFKEEDLFLNIKDLLRLKFAEGVCQK